MLSVHVREKLSCVGAYLEPSSDEANLTAIVKLFRNYFQGCLKTQSTISCADPEGGTGGPDPPPLEFENFP